MAKATVMGCACVVTSNLTPEEIRRFEKFDPEALILKKDGEPVYALQLTDENPGFVLEDRAEYSSVTTADGKATITILLDPAVEDRERHVRDQIGSGLLKLNELESQLQERTAGLLEMEQAAGQLISLQ